MADLTTLANANQWLGLGVPPQPTTDSLVSRLISAASAQIEQYMTTNPTLATYTEVRNGMGGQVMMLKNRPIVSVASVTIGGIVTPTQVIGPNVAQAYGFSYDESTIRLSGCYNFCRGQQNITIVYTAGFALTPYDVEQACLDTVGDWYRYRDRIGKVTEGIEGQSISFTNQALPVRARLILDKRGTVAPVY